MGDHTPGSDNNVVPYGNPGKYLSPRAEPDIIANRYRFVEHEPSVTLIGDQGMAGGMEAATGTDQNMIPEYDLSTVKDSHAMIGEELLPDFDIISIVAPERGIDIDPLPYLPEKF